MVEIEFSRLKKESPEHADELLTDQELLLVFLNSPVRNKIMKFAKLNNEEKNKIMEIVDYYARLKIEKEKKKKPKTRKEVLDIEVSLLKDIFKAEILKFKKISEENALKAAKQIINTEYPNSVILDMLETDKMATLAGLETKKEFPSEFLVFDVNNKRIIGVEVILK